MEKRKRSKAEWIRRYVSFVFILFVIAFGTSLSIRANLGSSPISAPPYVLSLVPGMPMTMGQIVICMHVFFILTQILLLRRNYELRQLSQILVSFLFGFYTDLTMWLTSFLQIPPTLDHTLGWPLQFAELLIGGALLAFGIACEVRCDSLMLAGEGLPLAIAKCVRKDFGKVKMCSDTALVTIAVVLMTTFFGHWDWKMVGPGTLVSMFYVGFMVRVFAPHIAWLDLLFIPKAERRQLAVEEWREERRADDGPLVVTIAREYGSGGQMLGEQLALRLGVDFYDHNIIDEAAERLGYTADFVRDNEQNISNGKLWELIFTDKSIPLSLNPSHDDAIFVAESRIIRALAGRKPCVIMGPLRQLGAAGREAGLQRLRHRQPRGRHRPRIDRREPLRRGGSPPHRPGEPRTQQPLPSVHGRPLDGRPRLRPGRQHQQRGTGAGRQHHPAMRERQNEKLMGR